MHSYPLYQDLQTARRAVSEVMCRRLVAASISVDNATERVLAEMVSGNYFSMLGVQPAAGRVFNSKEDDQVYNGHPVVVLTYDYWVNRFARDPNVVGKKILRQRPPYDYRRRVGARDSSGWIRRRSPQIRVRSR